MRVLTGTALELLELIPPFLRTDPIFLAICDAAGPQFDGLNAEIDRFERETKLATATDDGLSMIEQALGLMVADVSLSLEERKFLAKAVYRRATTDQSGAAWEFNVSLVLGSDWDYQEHDPDDPFSPPANTIVVFIPAAAGSAKARAAEAYIRTITPANTQLNVTSAEGFRLGESQLGEDLL